jgi:His Kinase A (phospho-acceptor) domain
LFNSCENIPFEIYASDQQCDFIEPDMIDTSRSKARMPAQPAIAPRAKGAFRLTRYFIVTSLIAFTAVGAALFFLQHQEEVFFAQVQTEQSAFFSKAQLALSRQQESTARDGLVAVHEAGHVNLARFLANTMWQKSVAPFMAEVQRLPIAQCRNLAAGPAIDGSNPDSARQACFRGIGEQIIGLPGFAALDTAATTAMRSSTVFKIKVFDMHGVTVYSSEHAQIGEDKAENLGWKTAANGVPASELTHRDRFSAFEGVVENRDLISSYVPVRMPDKDEVIGVFEIYSDVTPFLKEIKSTSARIAEITGANQAKVEHAANDNQQMVLANSDRFLSIVGGLLALLYVALLLLVRNAQRIIDKQHLAQEQAAQREQQWHREKMTALATMAARVSHEIGNPLATISGLAEGIASQQSGGENDAVGQPKLILEQTQRIARMLRQIADFATPRSDKPELVDVNQLAKAVCDFLSFDSRFRSTRIELKPDHQLPACVLIAEYLHEALTGLLQACVEGQSKPELILVETKLTGAELQINIGCEPITTNSIHAAADARADSRFDSAQRRVSELSGRLARTETGFILTLPVNADRATICDVD